MTVESEYNRLRDEVNDLKNRIIDLKSVLRPLMLLMEADITWGKITCGEIRKRLLARAKELVDG